MEGQVINANTVFPCLWPKCYWFDFVGVRKGYRLHATFWDSLCVMEGGVTPPSSVEATEAVNQEMETIPSLLPSGALSFTPPLCVKWTFAGYWVVPTAVPKSCYKF